ncbi:hypothetical protein CIB48_g3742 [Xylaria polymorpha]|nr:hypothetical protein CIB48_g3742 [Xylaria polymorpha]
MERSDVSKPPLAGPRTNDGKRMKPSNVYLKPHNKSPPPNAVPPMLTRPVVRVLRPLSSTVDRALWVDGYGTHTPPPSPRSRSHLHLRWKTD